MGLLFSFVASVAGSSCGLFNNCWFLFVESAVV